MKLRFKNRRWMQVSLAVIAVGIGCSTSNTNGWVISAPTTGQQFTYTGVDLPMTASGTCGVASITNNVGPIDPNTDQLLGTTGSVTSNATTPYSWSGNFTLQSLPPNTPLRGSANILVAMGKPVPTQNGTNIADYASVQVSVKNNPGGY